MQFYLGPLGDLRALPVIERDQTVEAAAGAVLAEHESLSGSRTVQRMGPHRRTWDLSWVYLTLDEADEIDALRRGLLGSPLWLVDPNRPNLLPPQIATAGCERRSTAGWTSSSGLRSWRRVTDLPARVRPRMNGVIEWERTSTTVGALSVGRNTRAQQTPALPHGGMVVVAGWVRRTSATPSAVRFGLDVWNAAGARSTYLGSSVTPGGWVDLTYTMMLPPGSAAFSPVWLVDAGQPAATLQVTAPRAGYGAIAPDPSSGGGAAVVYVRNMPETYPSLGEVSTGLTLVES